METTLDLDFSRAQDEAGAKKLLCEALSIYEDVFKLKNTEFYVLTIWPNKNKIILKTGVTDG